MSTAIAISARSSWSVCGPATPFREASPGSQRSEARLDIFGQLGRPCAVVDGLPTYRDWVDRAFGQFREQFDGHHGFRHHIDRAQALFDDIEGESWLLHGDLHHENLLADETRGWIAIDPKASLVRA
ncbi:MAG: aminoglycoside phosphotransferase family protein [Gammaproteobacteria bacterium]|nr:aminoglycoside phosphotransferase family protein [Gammaproteobacteria bacterium]